MENEENIDSKNYMRLQQLLHTFAASTLRQIFLDKWQSYYCSQWTNSEHAGQQYVNGIGANVYRVVGKNQKQALVTGNIMQWDITLLGQVIKSLDTSSKAKKPDQQLHKDIDSLKEVRNKLAHPGSLEISDEEFSQLWKTVADLLVRWGASASKLEDLKSKLLKEENAEPTEKEPTVDELNTQRALTLKDLGNEEYKNGHFAKAIDKYTEAMNLSSSIPTNDLSVLYSNRSVAYLKNGQCSEAKSDAKAAIHLRPVWWKGYYRLGNAYMALNKFEMALKNFNVALSLNPSSTEVKNDLAHCKMAIARIRRDEHLDPMNYPENYEEICEAQKRLFNVSSNPDQMAASVKFNSKLGLSVGICGEAHQHRFGINCPVDYERAAKLYAKAAMQGYAEGMYNLAQLTMEGKGVKRDMVEAFKLLKKAASQNIIVEILGNKIIHLGVAESEHSLGLHYADGDYFEQDFEKAIYWYERAIKHGSAASANNMGIIYQWGQGVRPSLQMALEYWKLAASRKLARGAENLAITYLGLRDAENAGKSYALTLKYGCMSIESRKGEFECLIGNNFEEEFAATTESYELELDEAVRQGPLKHLIDDTLPTPDKLQRGLGQSSKPKGKTSLVNTSTKDFEPMAPYRITMIKEHRQSVKDINSRATKTTFEGNPAKHKPKPLTDLIGLKPITLKEMNPKEEKVYEGFVIKFTIIEDAELRGKGASIALIGQDDNGDAQRIYVYNFPQDKDTQDCLGYGCRFSVVNPYFRLTRDGASAIRIDDPSLVFLHAHLTDKKRCRYCGSDGSAAGGNIPCRKCKRCFYCSKQCLKKDADELCHDLICKKRIL